MSSALPDESIQIGRMVDLTTLDTKIAGTTKSVHRFPPKNQNGCRKTNDIKQQKIGFKHPALVLYC